MRDHLEYYNHLDAEPFLQAVEKLFNASKELGLDAFKTSLTLPSLTLQLMFSDLPPGVYFTLINQSNSDLHQLIKKNVCGGLSVLFHREHQADVMYIRHREFVENAKLCRKILGYDANSLYLGALKRTMPTGHFIRYQSERTLNHPSVFELDCLQYNGCNGWRLTSRFKSRTSAMAVRCESVLDSCRWTVIVQKARQFFKFTAAGTMATIALAKPTNRPMKLEEDLAIEKPQTCKQKHKKNQRICAVVSRTWWRFTSASECTSAGLVTWKRGLSRDWRLSSQSTIWHRKKSSDICKMENSLAYSFGTLKHLKSSNQNSKSFARFSKTTWFRGKTLASTCVSTPSQTTSSRNLPDVDWELLSKGDFADNPSGQVLKCLSESLMLFRVFDYFHIFAAGQPTLSSHLSWAILRDFVKMRLATSSQHLKTF